jgi:hypothetical protein
LTLTAFGDLDRVQADGSASSEKPYRRRKVCSQPGRRQRFAEANLAVATGKPSGVVVIDIDGERACTLFRTILG